MKIRAIADHDLDALGQVYVDSFREVDPSEKWTVERGAELIKFILTKQQDLAFLAQDEGKIAGAILGMVKPWWDGNHLVETELFLSPAFQKRKIGTKLFHHYLDTARRLYDVTVIEAVTFKNLEFPISWYRSMGFKEKKDWQVMFGEVGDLIGYLDGEIDNHA